MACPDCNREHVDTGDGCPWCAADVKRKRGRPRLTPNQNPARVEVLLPVAVVEAIDATGQKRSAFIRAAVAKMLAG